MTCARLRLELAFSGALRIELVDGTGSDEHETAERESSSFASGMSGRSLMLKEVKALARAPSEGAEAVNDGFEKAEKEASGASGGGTEPDESESELFELERNSGGTPFFDFFLKVHEGRKSKFPSDCERWRLDTMKSSTDMVETPNKLVSNRTSSSRLSRNGQACLLTLWR